MRSGLKNRSSKLYQKKPSELELERAVVRVWEGNPEPTNSSGAVFLGTAFFVSPNQLLTVGHVLEVDDGKNRHSAL